MSSAEWHEAVEHLAESMAVDVDDATVQKLADVLDSETYIKAFAYMIEGQTLTDPSSVAALFHEAMVNEHNVGFDAGRKYEKGAKT